MHEKSGMDEKEQQKISSLKDGEMFPQKVEIVLQMVGGRVGSPVARGLLHCKDILQLAEADRLFNEKISTFLQRFAL